MEPMRISGAVSGIDTDSLVTQLMAIESRPVLLMRQRLAALELRRQSWQTLNTHIYNLQAKLAALIKPDTFDRTAVTSSNSTVATATGVSAVEGSYTVSVTCLAKAHTIASAVHASSDTAVGVSGTISVNGHDVAVSAADSLSDIAAGINAASAGARASLVQTAAGEWRLVLVSNTTGSGGQVELGGDLPALQAIGLVDEAGVTQTVQAGQDAALTVNGLSITSATNVLSDVLPGLTLTLGAEGTAKITVTRDAGAVTQAVTDFVTAYNAAIDFINAQLTHDPESGVAKPALYGESSLRRLKASLRSMATDPVAGLTGSLRSLWQAGVTTGAAGSATAREGKLVVDDAKLRALVASDLEGLKKLFGAGDTNVALGSAGATITASSEVDPLAPAAPSVIDGRTDSARWGSEGGGWQDATAGSYPDWLEIAFAGTRTIDRVDVYTLNSTAFPADTYGIRDYSLEYWKGDAWATLGSGSGNEAGIIGHSFSPVTTDRIRLTVLASNGANDHSRVLEIAAYERNSGVAGRLGELCRSFTLSGSGLVDAADRSLGRQVRDLNSQIKAAETRLESRKEALQRRFISMEQALSRMQSQSAWLAAQISSQFSGSGTSGRK
ncbi:MAG: flagellar filament capping protein FliD [Bacillota bacterium]|nr:flagellar filament capping protein FliD [Bacillota bacterium]